MQQIGHQRGFTLIELSVVLTIFGILVVGALPIVKAQLVKSQVSATENRLEAAEAALSAFVIRTGRLPCPADGSLPATDPNAGLEDGNPSRATCGSMRHGVLPWRTLGLSPADGSDGYGRRLTYRVDPLLTANSAACAADADTCPPAAGSCQPRGGMDITCLDPASAVVHDEVLSKRGLTVCADADCNQLLKARSLPGGDANPAAFVLISHGPTGFGGYDDSATILVTEPLSDAERPNRNNNGLSREESVPAGADGFIDTFDYDAERTFDDVLLHPALLQFAMQSGHGPRVQPDTGEGPGEDDNPEGDPQCRSGNNPHCDGNGNFNPPGQSKGKGKGKN